MSRYIKQPSLFSLAPCLLVFRTQILLILRLLVNSDKGVSSVQLFYKCRPTSSVCGCTNLVEASIEAYVKCVLRIFFVLFLPVISVCCAMHQIENLKHFFVSWKRYDEGKIQHTKTALGL